jgi:hypothetical protein
MAGGGWAAAVNSTHENHHFAAKFGAIDIGSAKSAF